MVTKHMLFANTREFHDAKREWFKTLVLPLPEYKLYPEAPSPLLGDLDLSSFKKRGVFFPLGNAFYYHRRLRLNDGDCAVEQRESGGFMNDPSGPLIGFAKLLLPHYGILFSVVDDLMGITSGGSCMTKTFEMDVSPHFTFSTGNYAFRTEINAKDMGNGRVESSTRLELFDPHTGGVVTTVNAVFVQTRETTAMVQSQHLLDSAVAWEQISSLRLSGAGPNDPTMSFVLTLPRPVVSIDDVPSWWQNTPIRSKCTELRENPFTGKFELYNVEFTLDGVRAVVLPRFTAEGPPTKAHGGFGASACLEVLFYLHPTLRVKTHRVRFRRPVPLEEKICIEWKCSSTAQGWEGEILDWEHNVLQQVTITEQQQDLARL